jgi:UDP-N-acetylmuramate--alanine ligase
MTMIIPRSVYFLGIGGIGMSALARFLHTQGSRIWGYDKTPTTLTDELSAEGMSIHFEENIDLIPEKIDLVIYTPAIPGDHKELRFFLDKKIPVLKRSEMLGKVTKDFSTLAVAGTHGKTTTSTLIAHILKTAGINATAFLGGISKNYRTNFISPSTIPDNSSEKNSVKKYVVVEADEFDRSFLQLYPEISVITSMDEDHLDIYTKPGELQSAFIEFAGHTMPEGSLIYKKGLPLELFSKSGISVKTYSLETGSDYFPSNIRTQEGLYEFDIVMPETVIEKVILGLPGRFNLENAIAASAVAHEIGISAEPIREALRTYAGVNRRFDFRVRTRDFVYIDDYAHHPEEIKACISAVREIYPGRRITGVFQPHLYSRTRDFLDQFARSLEKLDEVLLLDIYPARETPIPGITSQLLLERINVKQKKLCTGETLLSELVSLKPEILLTMGAGDIDQWADKIIQQFTGGKEIEG